MGLCSKKKERVREILGHSTHTMAVKEVNLRFLDELVQKVMPRVRVDRIVSNVTKAIHKHNIDGLVDPDLKKVTEKSKAHVVLQIINVVFAKAVMDEMKEHESGGEDGMSVCPGDSNTMIVDMLKSMQMSINELRPQPMATDGAELIIAELKGEVAELQAKLVAKGEEVLKLTKENTCIQKDLDMERSKSERAQTTMKNDKQAYEQELVSARADVARRIEEEVAERTTSWSQARQEADQEIARLKVELFQAQDEIASFQTERKRKLPTPRCSVERTEPEAA